MNTKIIAVANQKGGGKDHYSGKSVNALAACGMKVLLVVSTSGNAQDLGLA